MLAQLMCRFGIFKLFENEIIVYMNACSTQLKLKKMSNRYYFDRFLKTGCNFQHFTTNCRIKKWDERKSGFRYVGERKDHMLHSEQVFGNAFERKKTKLVKN